MSIPISRSLLTKRPVKITHQNHNHNIKPRWAHQEALPKPPRQKGPFFNPEANFSIGQRKVYLPDFTITLLCKPLLPPTHAQFRVPLDFTKPDLRDYLYHAYNVKVRSITTSIQGPKISPRTRNPDPSALRKPLNTRQRRLQRDIDNWAKEDKVQKFMTVHLEKPFVWPVRPSEETLDRLAGEQRGTRAMRVEAEKEREVDPDGAGKAVQRAKLEKAEDMARDLKKGKIRWGVPPIGGGADAKAAAGGGGLEDAVARKMRESQASA